jgi:hypothetical protein
MFLVDGCRSGLPTPKAAAQDGVQQHPGEASVAHGLEGATAGKFLPPLGKSVGLRLPGHHRLSQSLAKVLLGLAGLAARGCGSLAADASRPTVCLGSPSMRLKGPGCIFARFATPVPKNVFRWGGRTGKIIHAIETPQNQAPDDSPAFDPKFPECFPGCTGQGWPAEIMFPLLGLLRLKAHAG